MVETKIDCGYRIGKRLAGEHVFKSNHRHSPGDGDTAAAQPEIKIVCVKFARGAIRLVTGLFFLISALGERVIPGSGNFPASVILIGVMPGEYPVIHHSPM
jgi:hypothetical protein